MIERIFVVFAVVVSSPMAPRTAAAEGPSAVPVCLVRPVYPPIASAANVTGTVGVQLTISADGAVASAAALSGPALLVQAALDAARRSTFECRDCAGGTASYAIEFSFQYGISFKPIRESEQPAPVTLSASSSRVTVLEEPRLVRPYFSSVATRAAKCAYLWRCGAHWGGWDYYYYRVRAPKCLWLWRCRHELHEFYKQYNRDHAPARLPDLRPSCVRPTAANP